MNRSQKVLKRLFDLLISTVFLVILFPLFIIISVLIKLTSQGPILFCQSRIGEHGKIFKIFKFRTMINNAENIGDGLSIKSERDTRITKIGFFLRKTSLDELPQLLNIWLGEMSLVGPRPPVTYFPYQHYEGYPDWAKKRFSVKPGITGLAQVTVRNSVGWNERIKLDIDYIEHYSLKLDFKIILKTFLRVIKTDNIYN
ncbi:sugar transferase [Aerococcus sp. HMSC10H05]|uniref:sugar transferase n=1 Tax=Aerococcus sp. HMSC10H05 TaxID=1581084 RepID=UPI0008A3E12B|nr:sugar transferase [Aerococcus sp. HMSC10H05]OFU49971.1 sugar transferase [Aerococcus sp. HMSC10H05]